MRKSTVFVPLLICTLFAFTVSAGPQIEVFSGSNNWWVAVRIVGVDADTVASVFISDSRVSSVAMTKPPQGWPYWSYTSTLNQLGFPLTIKVVFKNGDQATLDKAVKSITTGTTQLFDVTVVAATTANKPPVVTPTQPSVVTPTQPPVVVAPKPDTASAGRPATNAKGCSAPTGVMVPLYVYPGAAWDLVIAGAAKVPTIAIINVNSGPGNGPDASYKTYMARMAAAGVIQIGYVNTLWGARPLADVKADINKWASEFPQVVGIFLDEGSTLAKDIPYYRELYNYIMGFPGWKYDVINPGVGADIGYLSISTQIVSYENTGAKLTQATTPAGASCNNRDHWVAMAHSVAVGNMDSIISKLVSMQYYGWIYVTDGAEGCCTYNALSNFYSKSIQSIGGK